MESLLLLNLITRLYDIDEGQITIGNNDIKNLNLNQLRKSIGYVPQDGFLFLEQYLKI